MTTPFTYSVLRYKHNPSTGEAVNVGVLIFAPTIGLVRFKGTTHTYALSKLFRGFERDVFMRFITALDRATQNLQETLESNRQQLPLLNGPVSQLTPQFLQQRELDVNQVTAEEVARWLVSDNGLSFQFGEARGGITDDVLNIHESLFDRLVTQQRPVRKDSERRSSDEVWANLQDALNKYGITRHLRPHTVKMPQFEDPIPFRHAYKNEKWHAIEPMSFDYVDARSIREKALLWYGYGAALKQATNFSQLYIVLGAPQDSSQMKDYNGAKNWLNRMENKPELIEEKEAPEFARELADTMRKEGVLTESEINAEQKKDTAALVAS